MSTELVTSTDVPAYFAPRESVVSMSVIYSRGDAGVEVRQCFAGRGVTMHGAESELFVHVDQARAALTARGLYCIGRMPDDEPRVVEVWL